MEIVGDNIDSANHNFIRDTSVCDDSNDVQRLNANKTENVIYSLNPLLSESLNNLVKRFERTKIPKPPPSKGHAIRKKSRIHASLPNIFLPSSFDDNIKYSEKKVQWTNKLSLDLEKMKSFFRENYSHWCKQKQRSRSIPNLARDNDEIDLPDSSSQNVDFVCSRSKDENIMTIKFTKCDPKSVTDNDGNEETILPKTNSTIIQEYERPEISRNDSNSQNIDMDTTESDDKHAYSTHLYLDGAIIEPISPASPLQSVLQSLSINEQSDKVSLEEIPSKLDDSIEIPAVNSPLPIKNKRGRKPRKKKAQAVVAKKVKPNIANSSTNVKEPVQEAIEAPNLEPEIIESNETAVISLSDNIEIINLIDCSKSEPKQEGKNSPDQTNDLEILSKSITNSVDTSMLPPRKRYKRLMYLENNKSGSPKDLSVTETVQKNEITNDVPELEIIDEQEIQIDDNKQAPRLAAQRSRSKRKKKTVSSIKSTSEKKAVLPSKLTKEEISNSPEPMECENEIVDKLLIEKEINSNRPESISKPESLKRSKREAAARGFANMVAMSLNNSNSSQSQDNSFESKQNAPIKKPGSSRADSNDTSSEASIGKIFKRPRKSKNIEIGPPKTKVKRSISPVASSDTDKSLHETKPKELENIDIEKTKIPKKSKEAIFVEENPPSPNETIISNDSGNQENIKYRKIRTNTYIDQKPLYWFEEVERCGCKPSKLRSLFDKPEITKPTGRGKLGKKRIGIVWDCGDNCLNRLTYTECQAKNCQCGDACGNQKIRKGEWAPGLKVKDFPGKGKGVITGKPIREGTFLIEYVGEVINEHTFQDRMMNLYRDDSHHYCLHLDGDMLIDAYRSGSIARLVNHSCQPNCEMQKWMVNGAYRMCLFAIEDIPADAELYYDYNFCSFNTKNTQICLCRSASCRGFIGSKPRAEQTESQKDRKKLLYIFGRLLSGREKIFILRNSIFLLRNRELGRCQRLGIRKPQVSHGNRLPSTISEIKRRKAKKNQFLTQMSALNSIRSIKTRLLQNAQDNENLTRTAQLGQILKDLYNTLLEQKDPLNQNQQLVAPFINCLNRKKYPEFYRMIGNDNIASLNQVYTRLLDGGYMTMMAFDQDILQMIHNVEFYAGKQSNIGQCAERIKPIYKELKMNSIALYEALTDEVFDEKDKQKLISNNLQLITNALAAIKSHSHTTDIDLTESGGVQKSKKRKQALPGCTVGARGRLERGAEVIKCICGFLIEAGHVMVQCDRCFVWQHAYCMNVARSSELADVTRMEPYYCHICLNIATESLIREIPRHFVISDETIGSNNTLFWTLLKSENLFKIDDFVYISCNDPKQTNIKSKQSKYSPNSSSSPNDLSRRTIMRIYSLWKDSNGQRWMEGGLFLRPYDNQLKSLAEKEAAKVVGSNKRKSSLSPIDLNTHKWHQYEVVYTDFTKILPLDCCLGRCFVLNSYTFRMGRPLLQNNLLNANLDVFVCDWMINQQGEWSEIDPGYLKVNTKSYCFERFQDSSNETVSHERFSRQYLAEDLLSIDEGFQPSVESNFHRVNSFNRKLSDDEKVSAKMQSLNKLLSKLVDFASERNQNLPLSSTPSSASGSTSSSRGASPLCENSGTKSPIRPLIELISHGSRKSSMPRKLVKNDEINESVDIVTTKSTPNESNEPNKEITTIASDASDSSPQLMIVVDEFQQTPKNDINACIEDSSKTTDKDNEEKDMEEKTVSSVRENVDDQSNLGSEINFGDFVNLLKSTERPPESVKEKVSKSKQKTGKVGTKIPRKGSKKSKKKIPVKKNELKPVSEISAAEDEWVPVNNSMKVSSNRPRTRSRKGITEPSNDEIEKCTESCSSNNNTEIELILTGLNIKGIFTNNNNSTSENPVELELKSSSPSQSNIDVVATSESGNMEDDYDDNTKSCFVKLERLKMKQRKERESLQSSLNTKNKNQNNPSKVEDISSSKKKIMESLSVSLSDNGSEMRFDESSQSKTYFNDSMKEDPTPKNYSKSQPNSSSSSDQSDMSKSDYTGIPLTSHMISLNKNSPDDKDSDKQESKNSTISTSNRSKRKKGVPKRIPFDFSYQQINTIKPVSLTGSSTFEDEVVDLSSCKTNLPDSQDHPLFNSPKIDTPDTNVHSTVPKKPDIITPSDTASTTNTTNVLNVPESRHITAANDFSSIENISSN